MGLLKILFSIFLPTQVFALVGHTPGQVAEHNTASDCWMIFEERVYDLSEYLPEHDKFMDIREWCGQDMTEDFKTKAGEGEDHEGFSYAMLEDYYTGELTLATQDSDVEITATQSVQEEKKQEAPYNIILPLFATLALYWFTYFIFKKKHLFKFNAFWNTVLLLTLLIPSLGFGVFMVLRYRVAKFREIDFDFMYWHVELSIVMGVTALSHLIQRFRQYIVQLKK